MCDDDWVKLAVSDDSLVVDVLLHLRQPPPPTTATNSNNSPCLHLNWTVRQRRSRSASRHVGSSADKKSDEPTRASPTTPLSWSGATSPSGGGGATAADGSEESSRPTKPLKTSRSKLQVANPSETTTTKRSRRKKTSAELKEEESMLLKEQRDLKSELATLRLTLEEQRSTNERLKRMKVDWESRQHMKTETTTMVVDLPRPVDTQCLASSHSLSPASVRRIVVDNALPVPPENECSEPQEFVKQEASFVLPDLNLPVDEEELSSVCLISS